MGSAQPNLVTVADLGITKEVIEAAILFGCPGVEGVGLRLEDDRVTEVHLFYVGELSPRELVRHVQQLLSFRFKLQVEPPAFSIAMPSVKPPLPVSSDAGTQELDAEHQESRRESRDATDLLPRASVEVPAGTTRELLSGYFLKCPDVTEVNAHWTGPHLHFSLTVKWPPQAVGDLIERCRTVSELVSQRSDGTHSVSFWFNGIPFEVNRSRGLPGATNMLGLVEVEQDRTAKVGIDVPEAPTLPPVHAPGLEEAAESLALALSREIASAARLDVSNAAQTAEALRIIRRQYAVAQGPLIDALNNSLAMFAQKERAFGSFEANQAVVNSLSEFARDLGLRFECQKPGCGEPSALVLLPGKTRDGAFAFRHSGTNHGGQTTLPPLRLIPTRKPAP